LEALALSGLAESVVEANEVLAGGLSVGPARVAFSMDSPPLFMNDLR
jgi:hypothetical protein